MNERWIKGEQLKCDENWWHWRVVTAIDAQLTKHSWIKIYFNTLDWITCAPSGYVSRDFHVLMYCHPVFIMLIPYMAAASCHKNLQLLFFFFFSFSYSLHIRFIMYFRPNPHFISLLSYRAAASLFFREMSFVLYLELLIYSSRLCEGGKQTCWLLMKRTSVLYIKPFQDSFFLVVVVVSS